MRVLFSLVVFFMCEQQLWAANSRILQLLVSGRGDKGSDFAAFVRVPSREVDTVGRGATYLYCFQAAKSNNRDWRFFAPCGRITPLFGNTYRVARFPDLGKMEEVFSGRPLRYGRAMVLGASNIPVEKIPKGDASSIRRFVQAQLDAKKGNFIGLEVLRYGSR